MMRAVTAEEMREIDRRAIEDYGIPAVLLMNNAGRAVSEFVINKFTESKVFIFCGTGNNGGDGLTAAYYLKNAGRDITVYLSGNSSRLSPASKVFLGICKSNGIKIIESGENCENVEIAHDSIVIDAILGTGFTGSATGAPLSFINIINRSRSIVVAVDIPSGLPSDGSLPDGAAVKADFTVTVGLPKISLVTFPCLEYCGEISVAEIGFPSGLTAPGESCVMLTDRDFVRSVIPGSTGDDINKTDRGHTLLAGGFDGMEGAIILAASALFEAGTGLASLATTENARKSIAGLVPELITIPLPDKTGMDYFTSMLCSRKYSSMIIGPGMGRTEQSKNIFSMTMEVLPSSGIRKVLIDGDGLYHLAGYLARKILPGGIDFIITPHFMEASRICGKSVEEIKKNRFCACIELSLSTGTTCLLKGPASIISDGRNTIINTTGNRGLAAAGSGDVLAGIIGSFLNMDIPVLYAGAAAMYLHGLCADIFRKEYIPESMKASDIIKNIRQALKEIH